MKPLACLCAALVVVLFTSPASTQPVPALFSISEVDGLQIGRSNTSTGDLDGDGVREILLGMPVDTIGDGGLPSQVRLYSGKTGVLLMTLTEDDVLDPAGRQQGLSLGQFGAAVVGLDKVSSTGLPGYAVSDPAGSVSGGYARMISGRTGATIFDIDLDLEAGAGFGTSVAGLSDVDHAGVPDFAVGVPGLDAVMIFRGEDCPWRPRALPRPRPAHPARAGKPARGRRSAIPPGGAGCTTSR
jgi:hypothetical protein